MARFIEIGDSWVNPDYVVSVFLGEKSNRVCVELVTGTVIHTYETNVQEILDKLNNKTKTYSVGVDYGFEVFPEPRQILYNKMKTGDIICEKDVRGDY